MYENRTAACWGLTSPALKETKAENGRPEFSAS